MAIKNNKRSQIGLFLLLAFGAAYFNHPVEYDNTDSRYFMLSSWVDYGRLDIEPYKDETIDVSVHDGKTYSNKAIGLPLLAAPVYWSLRRFTPIRRDAPISPRARYLCRVAAVSLPFALLGLFLFRALVDLGANEETAYLTVLAYAFGTIAWIHAALFSGHETAAALGFFSFYSSRINSRRSNPARWALAGLLAGGAALCDYASVYLAAVVGVYALWKAGTIRDRAWILLGAAVPASILGAYNWACFGAPISFSYGHLAPAAFGPQANAGLFGVTFPNPKALLALIASPGRGVLFLMPVLLLSLPALFRKILPRDEAWMIRVLILGYFWINASYFGWHGGWTFGPRYLVPLLPFLALPMAFAMSRFWFIPLFALSAVQVASAQFVMPHTPEIAWNPIVEVIVPLAKYGYWSQNLGTKAGLGEFPSLVLFFALAAGLAWSFRPVDRPSAHVGIKPAAGWRKLFAAASAIVPLTLLLLRSPAPWPRILHACKGHLLGNAAYQLSSVRLQEAANYENWLGRPGSK